MLSTGEEDRPIKKLKIKYELWLKLFISAISIALVFGYVNTDIKEFLYFQERITWKGFLLSVEEIILVNYSYQKCRNQLSIFCLFLHIAWKNIKNSWKYNRNGASCPNILWQANKEEIREKVK